MEFFTLDIKDNLSGLVKPYKIQYEIQPNNYYIVDLYDESGKPLFQAPCDGALVCFDKVRNFIYSFGKITAIHSEHVKEGNRSFQDELLKKNHTFSFEVNEIKFQIRYYDDRIDISSFGDNYNGLIKVFLLDNSGKSKAQREQILNEYREEIVLHVKKIVSNNNLLYDNFDIEYQFNEQDSNTNSELIKTFKINLKPDKINSAI